MVRTTSTKKAARARSKPSDPDPAKALKAAFDAAHKAGQEALQERDFARMARVIERERELIEKQRTRIEKKSKNRKG